MDKKELINTILDMSDDQLSDISNYIIKAQEGTKLNQIKTQTDTFDKFMQYLSKTDRNSPDYDYELFYNNKDTNEKGQTPYEEWVIKESITPGEAHMQGRFKKPWHPTYEGENGENWQNINGLGWVYSVPKGHKDKNGKEYTLDFYKKYWKDNERGSYFVYDGVMHSNNELPEVVVTPEKKEQGGILSFNNQNVQYIEVEMEDFFNEENNN